MSIYFSLQNIVAASLRDALPERCKTPQRRASHSEAATACCEQKNEFFFHERYGNRRGPPPKGFAGGDGALAGEVSSAVTTRSLFFRPSATSVTTPSLIPVLICAGLGRLTPFGNT